MEPRDVTTVRKQRSAWSFYIPPILAGNVAQKVSLPKKLFPLLCSCVQAVLQQSSIKLSLHNLPTFFFSFGLMACYSFPHSPPLPSNARAVSLPLIYHFLLPLSSLSPAISVPVRLRAPLSEFLSGSLTLTPPFFSPSSQPSSLPRPWTSSSLHLPFFLSLLRSLYHQSLYQLPIPSHTQPHAHTHTHTRAHPISSFIFHLCQSPWSCLRESNPPSNLSLYSYSLFDSRSFLFSIFLLSALCVWVSKWI